MSFASLKRIVFAFLDHWVDDAMSEFEQHRARMFVFLLWQTLALVGSVLVPMALYLPSYFLIAPSLYLGEVATALILLHYNPKLQKMIYGIHLVSAIGVITTVGCQIPIRAVPYCMVWLTLFPLMSIYFLGPRFGLYFILGLSLTSTSVVGFYFLQFVPMDFISRLELVEGLIFIEFFTLFIAGCTYWFYKEMSRLEQAIVQKNRQLRDSEIVLVQSAKWAAIGEIAHGISHEINNPLAIASLNNEVMAEEYPEDAFIQERTVKIDGALRRISKVVESLARSTIEPRNEVEKSYPISNVIDTALDLCHQSFAADEVKIDWQIADEVRVYCQLNEVVEALCNILLNARDALKGQGQKVITVSHGRFDDWGYIRVADTGPGIPEAVQPRIFEPFFMHNKEVGDGVGLGLAVAKANCEKNNGQVRQLEGMPTTFEITLPLCLVELEAAS